MWRKLLGLSREQLGAELNVTFQQLQKYERSTDRISASRLWEISQILDVPIVYCSDYMTETTMCSLPQRVASDVDSDMPANEAVKDSMARREKLKLVRVYYTIKDAGIRSSAASIVKSIAATLPSK